MGMHVVAIGNPFDGLTLYGPFNTHDEALLFREKFDIDADWNIVRLHHESELYELTA